MDTNSGSNNAYPGGLAYAADDRTVYATLSVLNQLAVIDVASHAIKAQIPVGNAPHSVVLAGGFAWVSNEGGRPAVADDTTNNSDGTGIVSDPYHGSAATGTLSVVDLATQRQVATVPVGLHPTELALSPDRATLYVANTNSDTVSVVDVASRAVRSTIDVVPFPQALYGSHADGLAVLSDGRLAVSLGRDNAIALYAPPAGTDPARFLGLVPTGWYPSAVVEDPVRHQLVVANDKGVGNLGPRAAAGDGTGGGTLSGYVASASLVPLPTTPELVAGTAAVGGNNGWDGIDTVCARPGVAPTAIPPHMGEPSTIKHVIYVAKENRTYDQILGDDVRGNGDPKLVQFGQQNTPNQHALVKDFPLLDNFYDSAQLSADGHQWFVQGDSPDYLEKAFGGFTRSYPSLAGDALAYLPSGFIWENALRHGKTVKDYGKYANSIGKGTTQSDVPSLQPLLSPTYAGFDPTRTDQERMSVYLADFAQATAPGGQLPNLTLMSLPQDHTTGYAPTYPSASSEVADNDLAVGRLVDAVSHSRYWADTAILIEEDDSQNGLDHVDGHRSTFYLASPYAVRGGVVDHTAYTQVNALRTVEQILGLPPMNQLDLAASPMRSLFTDTPDLTPFSAVAASPSLGATNPPLSQMSGLQREWGQASALMDFSHPDAVEPTVLNHAQFYAATGFRTPYPGEQRVLHPAELAAGRVNRDEAAPDRDELVRAADRAHTAALQARPAGAVPAALTQDPTATCLSVSPPVVPEAGRPVLLVVLAAVAAAGGLAVRRRRRA